jgi:cytochrome c-type biogenesis protein
MQELVAEWYVLLSRLNAAVVDPLTALADGIGLPFISAFFFGLLGATSPCQLTTNAGALAVVAHDANDRRAVARRALAYLLGKALVYMVLGVAVILAGRQLAQSSIPVIVITRKLIGPLMILLGLYILGLAPFRFSLGQRLVGWLEARAGSGARGAFLLGIAFSFAFCPTLFLLFFGLTIPLALQSSIGILYPGIFAFGTTIPLLALSGLLTVGAGTTKAYLAGTAHVNAWLRPIAAAMLVLAGLNDTVVYWFL